MAGGRIKGITIEIDGSTTGLNKALKETESSLSSTQRSLKDVNRLLKVDPTSTELLSQKQKLLAQAVGDTKTKLDSLKQASEQAAKTAGNYDAWKEKYDPLQKEVDETKTKLQELKQKQEDLEKSGNIDTEEYKKLQQEVNNTNSHLKDLKAQQKLVDEEFGKPISPEKFDALQREIIETEQNLKSLERQAERASSVIGTVMQEAGSKLKDTGSKISGAGTNMLPVTAGVAAAGGAAIKYASDTEESVNKVDVAFGKSAGKVKEFAESALENFGMAKGSALDAAATFGDMGTSMGLSKKTAADMATSLTGLGGDLASFKNIGVDQAMTALNGVFTGETESLKQLGIVMTQSNLDAFAMANGFGKTTKEMTEAEKVQLRYAYVMDATKNAQGDFARTSDGTANALRTSQEGAKELAASFGEMLLPAIANILGKVNDVIKYFSNMDDKTKKVIITIAGIIAVVGPALIIIGSVISAIGTITGAIGTLITFLTPAIPSVAGVGTAAAGASAGVGLLSGNLLLIIGIIAGLVAGGVWLYKNWDTLKAKAAELKTGVVNKFNELKTGAIEKINSLKTEATNKINELKTGAVEKVSSLKTGVVNKFNELKTGSIEKIDSLKTSAINKFNGIKDGITGKIESAKNKVKGAIDKMKGFMKFEWSLPKLKMPHINITGKFSLNPPQTPKFNISWHGIAMDKVMTMTGPSIFGYNAKTNSLLAGGEKGNEILTGEGHMIDLIDNAVQSAYMVMERQIDQLTKTVQKYFPQVIENMDRDVVMDGDTIVGKLAPKMDAKLGRISKHKERGN